MKTYGPELIKEIGEKLADPAAVCAKIGMCTAAAEEESKEETPQLAESSEEGKKTTFAEGSRNILKKIRVVQAMQAAQIKHQNI